LNAPGRGHGKDFRSHAAHAARGNHSGMQSPGSEAAPVNARSEEEPRDFGTGIL
jgi:hypothetical protein